MLAAAGTMGALMLATPVSAAEIVLLSSTAMREALEDLVPAFEKASGHKVTIIFNQVSMYRPRCVPAIRPTSRSRLIPRSTSS